MPITKNKVSYTLNLEDEMDKAGIKPSKRKALSELIGVTVLDEIVQYLDKGKTPVKNGQYKRSLSKEYKEKKKKEGKATFADMQLTESMLNNLRIDARKDSMTIKLTDRTEKLKAYNHNKGETLPVRQWLPDDSEDEELNIRIMKKVKDTIKDASED